jgi:hypothetical protein
MKSGHFEGDWKTDKEMVSSQSGKKSSQQND